MAQTKPIINIEPEAWHKMMTYSKTAYSLHATEIGGMAEVHRVNGEWLISNPAILKQETSGARTELNKVALAEYLSTIGYKNKEHLESNDFLFLWWHTHPNFGAEMSSTDWKTIDQYTENGPGLSLVINNDGEYELIFSIIDPMITQVNCSLNVCYDFDKDFESEINELCTKAVTVPYYNKYGYGNHYGFGNSKLKTVHDDQLSFIETPVTTIKNESKIVDENILSQVMFDIDNALNDYQNDKKKSDEFILLIEQINDKFSDICIKFVVPKKEDLIGVTCAADLIEEDGFNEYLTVV